MRSVRNASLVVAVLGTWVVAACTSSSGSSGGVALEGGTQAGDDGGADALGGAAGGGQLSLYSAKGLSSFIAAFAQAMPGAGLANGCTLEPVGPCKVITCPMMDAAAGPAAKLTNAGTITATGGLIPGAGLTLTAGPDGKYVPLSGTVPLWIGGETLSFTAGGGPVPGFTRTAVAPTAGLSITSPTLKNGGSLLISRSSDLAVGWAIGAIPAAGKTAILIGSTGGKSLSCSFDVAALSGAIPSAALGKLGAGAGSFTFAVFSSTTSAIGDYSLTIEMTTPATAAGEDFTFAAATLQ